MKKTKVTICLHTIRNTIKKGRERESERERERERAREKER
jgi:hypothetical protein